VPLFFNELKELIKVNIKSSNIFGCELCQKNNQFLWKRPSSVIFHKCFINFFERVSSTHFGNTIFMDHNHVRTMWNPINNVLLVVKWNNRVEVSLNYFIMVVLPYLEALHSFRELVCIF